MELLVADSCALPNKGDPVGFWESASMAREGDNVWHSWLEVIYFKYVIFGAMYNVLLVYDKLVKNFSQLNWEALGAPGWLSR